MTKNLISKNGLYDIPMEFYHSQCCVGPSTSSTDLRRLFLESPAHCYAKSSLNPDRKPQADTKAFVLGRAAHHLLLGEDAFSTLYTVRPDKAPDGREWNGNNLTCKKWIADQQNAGRTVVTMEQIDAIRGMAKSLAKHPLVEAGILNGQIEKSLIWRDEETGIWIKSRPDAIPNDSGDFGDLKTSAEIGFKLDQAVSKYRYDMQGAIVRMGAKEVLGIDMAEFSFIFAENDDPYSVDVLTLKAGDLDDAEKDVRTALRTMKWCIDHDDWFHPSGTQRDARYVHISERAKTEALNRREFLEREIKPAEMAGITQAEYLAEVRTA